MKDDRARIDETLKYIGALHMGVAMSSQGVQEVEAFARNFIATRYPKTAWHTYNTVMHEFSQKMSLGYTYLGQETVPERKRLRAIFLLTAAVRDAGNLSLANLPLPRTYVNPAVMLVDIMWKARIAWAQVNGTTLAHQELLTYIRQNTATFLSTNPLNIYGSTAQAVDQYTNLPTDQNVLNFEFQYNTGQQRYEFVPPGGGLPGAYAVPVASVKAVHWTDVPGRGMLPQPTNIAPASFDSIHGTELGGNGVKLMVTTQFTGCTFCVKTDGTKVFAAHISPAGPNAPAVLNATVLAQQLDGQDQYVVAGDFANSAGGIYPFHVYGRGYTNINGLGGTGYPLTGQMYLLGVRTVTGWKIFSQHRNGMQITAAPVQIY